MVFTVGDQLLAEGINKAIKVNPSLKNNPNKLHIEQSSQILKDMHRVVRTNIDEHLNKKVTETVRQVSGMTLDPIMISIVDVETCPFLI